MVPASYLQEVIQLSVLAEPNHKDVVGKQTPMAAACEESRTVKGTCEAAVQCHALPQNFVEQGTSSLVQHSEQGNTAGIPHPLTQEEDAQASKHDVTSPVPHSTVSSHEGNACDHGHEVAGDPISAHDTERDEACASLPCTLPPPASVAPVSRFHRMTDCELSAELVQLGEKLELIHASMHNDELQQDDALSLDQVMDHISCIESEFVRRGERHGRR